MGKFMLEENSDPQGLEFFLKLKTKVYFKVISYLRYLNTKNQMERFRDFIIILKTKNMSKNLFIFHFNISND